jgi:hypothetical protein
MAGVLTVRECEAMKAELSVVATSQGVSRIDSHHEKLGRSKKVSTGAQPCQHLDF